MPRVGETFRVRALDARAAPVVGAVLELGADPAESLRFTTATDGAANLVVAAPGDYDLAWQVDKAFRVVMPISVVVPDSRLALAVWTLPLGLLFLWSTLRRRSRAATTRCSSFVTDPPKTRNAAAPTGADSP